MYALSELIDKTALSPYQEILYNITDMKTFEIMNDVTNSDETKTNQHN